MGGKGRLRKRFQLVTGTFAIVPKQSVAATDKTGCLVLPTRHYPGCIDKHDVR